MHDAANDMPQRAIFASIYPVHKEQQMKRTTTLFACILSLSILAALVVPGLPGVPTGQAAPVAVITVTNLNSSGAGSLRQAIADAASGDTIDFSVTGTILLADLGELIIDKNLIIDGPGAANLTIRPAVGPFRVFRIDSGTVTISGLTISHGSTSDGGGIYNHGTLTVSNCILSNNSATDEGGGIYNDGTLTVTNSTFTGNTAGDGGGINNSGILTVSGSTFTGNSAAGGGGIDNNGTLTVSSSTFSGNSATTNGGGIRNNGASSMLRNSTFSGNMATNNGGGIYNVKTITVANSTLSGNTATNQGGGIYNNNASSTSATVTAINSTLSGNSATNNGGGVYNNLGTLNYANTIIANSTGGGDCVNSGGTLGTNTNNLAEDNSCSPTYSGDPDLAGLSGGVHVPQGDSPVIDAGDAATCAAAPVSGLDQRGEARDDLGCDIGAVEVKLSDTDTITKNVAGAGTYTFGPTLVQIEVTASGALSQLIVQHHSGDHPNATSMNGQWWEITPDDSGFTANLNLPHTVSPDTDAKVCKHVSGSTWDCARTGSSAPRVWRDGLTAFSDWAVGDKVGPNAVTLRGLTAQAGGGFTGAAALLGLLVAGLLAVSRRRRPA
jgi:predicted outer membrane repeat protein